MVTRDPGEDAAERWWEVAIQEVGAGILQHFTTVMGVVGAPLLTLWVERNGNGEAPSI